MRFKLATAALLLLAPLCVIGISHAQDAGRASNPAPDEAPAKADAPDEDQSVRGEVKRVTAYRGQAMVSREVPVQEGTGLMEIVVGGMPEQIISSSLFADGGEGLEVRAVRYRQRVIGKAARGDVQDLLNQLNAVDALIRANTADLTLWQQQSTFLTSLEKFASDVSLEERKAGILNADELQKLTEFLFSTRKDLAARHHQLSEDSRDLQARRTDLQNQINYYGARGTRVLSEAVIFIDKDRAAATKVNLNYLVAGVDWRPIYTVRAKSGAEQVKLEYSAMITQTSGENWKDVELTLSTASPALVAQGVMLEPLRVTLAMGSSPQASAPQAEVVQEYRRLRSAQSETARGSGGRDMKSSNDALEQYEEERQSNSRIQSRLNSLANELQRLEFEQGNKLDTTQNTTEGISVEYRLDGTHGIASRWEQQFIGIVEHNLSAEFAFVATPALSDYVYLQAELKNNTATVLLEGPYTAYLDGRFVGRSALPMVARGESFTVGFGIDEQLRVSRKLESKRESMQGGNRITTFNYTISLMNYKKEAIKLRVFDRVPVAEGHQLRVNIEEEGMTPLSTDRAYVKNEKPEGILRWDVDVPASSSGPDAAEINYRYTLEYDRQMRIVIPAK